MKIWHNNILFFGILLVCTLVCNVFAQEGAIYVTSTPTGAPFHLTAPDISFDLTSSTPYTNLSVTGDVTYNLSWQSVPEFFSPPDTSAFLTSSDSVVFIGTYTASTPNAPDNLIITFVNNAEIDLLWQDHSNAEDGFWIERALASDSNFSGIAITLPNQTTFNDSGLTPLTGYLYRVSAFNSAATTNPSNWVIATTLDNPPEPPTNLVATALDSVSIQLNWDDNSDNEQGFEIEEAQLPSGAFFLLDVVGPNVSVYTASGLIPCTQYNYRVRAYNNGGQLKSDYSNESSAITLNSDPAVAGFTASVVSGFSPLTVHFFDQSSSATGWFWDFGDGNTSTDKNPIHAYVVTSLTSFTVTQIVSNSCGSDTSIQNDYILVDGSPTNLTAITNSSTDVTLNWQDNSSNETGFELDRKDGPAGSFSLLTTLDPDTTTFNDTGLTPSSVYYYRLRAANSGNGSFSPYIYAQVTTPGPPIVEFSSITSGFSPMVVQFVDQSLNAETWEWNFGDGSIDSTPSPVHIYSPSENTTYTVALVISNGFGSASVVKADYITVGLPPTNLVVNVTTNNVYGMALNWQDHSNNEIGFQIFREDTAGNGFVLATTVGPDVTSFDDFSSDTTIGLDSTIRHTYRVCAFSADTISAFTNDGIALAVANFFAIPSSSFAISNQAVVNFIDQSINANRWNWDFADGSFSTETNPVHTFTLTTGAIFYVIESVDNGAAIGNTTTMPVYIGQPPSGLAASAIDTASLNLTWNDNSFNEIGFLLERQTNGGGYVQIADLPPNTTSHPDSGLTPLTNYDYRIRAYNSIQTSQYSNILSLQTQDLARPVAFFTAAPVRGFSVLTVHFNNLSTNTTALFFPSWSWDFGDGGTSNLSDPIHAFSSPTVRQYSVKLITNNVFGSSTSIATNYVTVSQPGKFGTIPDFKFNLNVAQSNLLDLDNYTTSGLSWSSFAGANFAKPTVGSGNQISFNSPASSSAGADTVNFTASLTDANGFASMVKYSTYVFKKLPSAIKKGSKYIENKSIGLNGYVLNSSPPSYPIGPQVRPSYTSDSGKIGASITSGGTLTLSASSIALKSSVDVIVAAAANSNDFDKEIVRVYEVLNPFDHLTVASDTSAYGYETTVDGPKGMPQVTWLPTYLGESGIIRMSFSLMSEAIKITPTTSNFVAASTGWYTVRARMICNATTLKNTFSPIIYAFTGVPPSPAEVSGVAQFSMATTWTWYEAPIYCTGNSIYPQIVIRNFSTSLKNVYLSDIEVIPKKPALIYAHGKTRVSVSGGGFDSAADSTHYSFEAPAATTKAGYSIANGKLDVAISGTSGLKITAISSTKFTLNTPVTKGNDAGAFCTVSTSGSLTNPSVLIIAYGTDSATSNTIRQIGAYATLFTVPNASAGYTARAIFTSNYPYIYHQVVLKGSGTGDIYLDDVYPQVDSDNIYYWDHSLF